MNGMEVNGILRTWNVRTERQDQFNPLIYIRSCSLIIPNEGMHGGMNGSSSERGMPQPNTERMKTKYRLEVVTSYK